MKNILFFLVPLLVILVGCAGQTMDGRLTDDGSPAGNTGDAGDADNTDGSAAGGMGNMPADYDDHIGCQEDEIGIGGTCVPAKTNNAGLFERDLDDVVSFIDTDEAGGGFVAQPITDGDYPGIVMIHEWWGLNDNVKYMAKLLASEGYIVYAVDLYGGQVASDSSKAGELASSVRNNPDLAVAQMSQAVAYLRQEGATKVASLGWCFGGQQSLLLSLNADLDATVIYYGQLVTDADELQTISEPVLGIFASEDQGIPPTMVRAFESSLDQLDVENEIYIYEGVGHAFANPSGSSYAPEQTKDAWAKTIRFLDEHLKDDDQVDEDTGSGDDRAADNGMIDEDDVAEDRKVFELTGRNFRFYQGSVESPNLKVDLGDTVRIVFNAEDMLHDWVVDEFGAATQQVAVGQTTTVEFVADKAGTFEYYCSVGAHRARGMKGNLIVE